MKNTNFGMIVSAVNEFVINSVMIIRYGGTAFTIS